MSDPIRILVIDPSVSVYRAIRSAVSDLDEFEIAAFVNDMDNAVDVARDSWVDVIVLGTNKANRATVGLVRQLHRLDPSLPILLFTPDSLHDATVSLEALSAGATERIGRPAQNSRGQLDSTVRNALLPAVKSWNQTSRFRRTKNSLLSSSREVAAAVKSAWKRESGSVPTGQATNRDAGVLAIGCSSGGVQALRTMLAALPASYPRPVVVVQHILPQFARLVVNALDCACELSACEAMDGQELKQGGLYIAPGDRHLRVRALAGGRIGFELGEDPPVNACRPSVDVFFSSAAEVFGGKTKGVILTGMGTDGTDGCRKIREAGGLVLVQDRETCTAWGMARSVEEAGLANEVLALEELGPRVAELEHCVALAK